MKTNGGAAPGTNGWKRLVIDPLTRVEGHGKVVILLDQKNRVRQARLHVVEFRGFERFLRGRFFWEVPVIVQRLCGICPVSHHLAAAKAMDVVVGADRLTPTAEKNRRLMHYGQTLQSHALHFFHLVSPDLLFGFDAEPASRNVVGVSRKFPELAKQGVLLRKYGQEIIKATAGKRIHGTGAVPGGVNKSLTTAERDGFLRDIDSVLQWAGAALKIARDYTVEHLDQLGSLGSFDSNHLSIARGDGTLDLYDGNLRAVDATGTVIFDGVAPPDYRAWIAEEVRPWSYMKFPFIKSLGPENGWYRVGPLARLNVCDRIDTPEAEAARKELRALTGGKPNNIGMAYHWARMVELLHAAEKIRELLEDSDVLGRDLVVRGERRSAGVGVIEAPRGTLFHHYEVDDSDRITMANLIVSTTSNNEPMNRALTQVAERHFEGRRRRELTEGMLNRVEVAIRAYDPCLSCATHALGAMPLVIELRDADGNLLDRRGRGRPAPGAEGEESRGGDGRAARAAAERAEAVPLARPRAHARRR